MPYNNCIYILVSIDTNVYDDITDTFIDHIVHNEVI